MRVTVIDYKAGNLTSVLKALRHSVPSRRSPTAISRSSNRRAHRSSRRGPLQCNRPARFHRPDRRGPPAIARGVPFLGICVGMQWLYAGSSEAPGQPGLGYFPEQCEHFPESHEKVPHVGWNSLEVRDGSRLLAGVEPGEFVYFTHSYKGPSQPTPRP